MRHVDGLADITQYHDSGGIRGQQIRLVRDLGLSIVILRVFRRGSVADYIYTDGLSETVYHVGSKDLDGGGERTIEFGSRLVRVTDMAGAAFRGEPSPSGVDFSSRSPPMALSSEASWQ